MSLKPPPAGNLGHQFERSLRMLQMAVSARARDDSWREPVRSIISQLGSLNQATEGAFLAVSGQLMEFLSDSRQLHSELEVLAARVSAEQARNAGQSLRTVREHALSLEQRLGTRLDDLQSLRESATRIRAGFSGFEGIALRFHITAVLARIETAHLTISLDMSRQDLSNLADEVLASSDAIQDRAGKVLAAANEFDTRINATLAEVTRFEDTQLKQLPDILASVDQDLHAVENQQQAAGQVSKTLAADLRLVTDDLNRIAVAVQFHDITRQQIEHVCLALEGILANAPHGALTPEGASVVRLQKAQLTTAARSFVESAGRIAAQLDAVAAHASRMSDSAKAILGDDTGNSFLVDLGQRLSAILNMLDQIQAQDAVTRSVVGELGTVSASLQGSISELHSLECQLNRIALNALISATQLGGVGEPLNVVASAMQALEQECSTRSTAAESAMAAISQATGALTSSGETDETGTTQVVDDLRRGMGDLDAASSATASTLKSVSSLTASLSEKLADARSHLSVIREFEETVDRAVAEFDRIAADTCAAWWSRPVAPALADAAHYTMQTERNVHERITTAVAAEPAAEEVPAGDDGGDVEFF